VLLQSLSLVGSLQHRLHPSDFRQKVIRRSHNNWSSTDQGSISTSTAESEIKAVNHTLKAEVIANRGILNTIGWKQAPTRIEEDNQAAVFHSKSSHMTRNLRHLDLCQNWIKEKVADGTCYLHKVASQDNNSDIGTKRVPLPVFNKLTSQIVDRTLRTNL
jgi:hypothetical protein